MRSRLTYGVKGWPPREEKIRNLEVFWIGCLSSMVKDGWRRKNINEGDYSLQYTNQEVQNIVETVPLREVIHAQYLKYIAHVCRHENKFASLTLKRLLEEFTGTGPALFDSCQEIHSLMAGEFNTEYLLYMLMCTSPVLSCLLTHG